MEIAKEVEDLQEFPRYPKESKQDMCKW